MKILCWGQLMDLQEWRTGEDDGGIHMSAFSKSSEMS